MTQEITHLYLLSLQCGLLTIHTHFAERPISFVTFSPSHCILQIDQIKEMTAGTLPSLPCLSEIALHDGIWGLSLIIHTLQHWSKSGSILRTTYLIILSHQIGPYQYLNFHISNCILCQGCTDLFEFPNPKMFSHLPRRTKKTRMGA